MKYSYDYKLMCVDLYQQGKWPDTPAGIKDKTFRVKIRLWVRQEDVCGTESLRAFESFSRAIEEYIDYYNNRRIQAKASWMPPSKFREASMMRN